MASSILTKSTALLFGLTAVLNSVGLAHAAEVDQNGLLLEPPIQTAEAVAEKEQVEPLEKEYLEDMQLKAQEQSPLEIIYNLPQWVDEVTSVCPWRSASNEEQQGYIRLIRTEENGANQLYVQWMQKLPPNKDVALATRVIEEIAQGPRLKIELPQQEMHSRYCKLSAYAHSLDSNDQYRLKLKLEAPGKYQFERVKALGRNSR